MQKTVTACFPAFQINCILILIIQVEGRVVQRKRGDGLGVQINSAVFVQRSDKASVPVPIVGGLIFVLISTEAKGGVLNRNFSRIDDVVVNRNIPVGQTVFVQHAVAGESEIVAGGIVNHIVRVLSAFNVVVNHPGAAARGVKRDDRNLTRGTRFNKNRIVSFVVASAQRIVAGHKIRFLLSGGKRHLFRRINGTSQSHVAGTCRPRIVVQEIAGDIYGVIIINRTASSIITRSIIADEISGNIPYGATVKYCTAMRSGITDEISGNIPYGGTTIIYRAALNRRNVVTDEIPGNITDGATVKYCTAFSSRIPDKISGNISYSAFIINRTAIRHARRSSRITNKIPGNISYSTSIIYCATRRNSRRSSSRITDKISGDIPDDTIIIYHTAIKVRRSRGSTNEISGDIPDNTTIIIIYHAAISRANKSSRITDKVGINVHIAVILSIINSTAISFRRRNSVKYNVGDVGAAEGIVNSSIGNRIIVRLGIGILKISGLVVGESDGNDAAYFAVRQIIIFIVLLRFRHFRPCDAF